MAIILPSGFSITSNDPVDSRITVADQAARLGFSAANVYEGLLMYQQDTNELYVLVTPGSPSLNASWQLVGGSLSINSPYSVITLDGSGNATASLALTYRNDTVSLTGSLSITNTSGSFAFVQNQGIVLSMESTVDDFFIIKNRTSNETLFKINSSGTIVLRDQLTTPQAYSGGLIYSASNFYVGLE